MYVLISSACISIRTIYSDRHKVRERKKNKSDTSEGAGNPRSFFFFFFFCCCCFCCCYCCFFFFFCCCYCCFFFFFFCCFLFLKGSIEPLPLRRQPFLCIMFCSRSRRLPHYVLQPVPQASALRSAAGPAGFRITFCSWSRSQLRSQ